MGDTGISTSWYYPVSTSRSPSVSSDPVSPSRRPAVMMMYFICSCSLAAHGGRQLSLSSRLDRRQQVRWRWGGDRLKTHAAGEYFSRHPGSLAGGRTEPGVHLAAGCGRLEGWRQWQRPFGRESACGPGKGVVSLPHGGAGGVDTSAQLCQSHRRFLSPCRVVLERIRQEKHAGKGGYGRQAGTR
jgi:hypothetical protein